MHNATARIASEQAKTFEALLKLADLDGQKPAAKKKEPEPKEHEQERQASTHRAPSASGGIPFAGLRYNVEVHLPATKDVEVYNSIFKALKEHLLED